MKYLILSMLFMSTLGGCDETKVDSNAENLATVQAEKAADFACLNEQADKPVSVEAAKSRLSGTWQLKAIMTMIPNNKVPNIVLKIDKDFTATVTKAGKVIHTDKLTVTDEKNGTYNFLTIESSRKNFSDDDYNFLYGGLRICENEMLIDNGMAFDAPGYYFRRK